MDLAEKVGEVNDGLVTLADMEVGDSGVIFKVGAVGEIKKRLLEMGVVAGSRVKVIRLAPLGDPIEVLIKGYHLSLRNSEASEIQVRLDG